MVEQVARARIRVVKCPRCQKLLPELPSYAIYLCGGCGSALQAKREIRLSGVSSEIYNEESIKYLAIFRDGVVPEVSSEIDRQSDRTSRGVAAVSDRNSASGSEDTGSFNDPRTSNSDGSSLRHNPIVRKEGNFRSFSRAPGINKRKIVVDQLVEENTHNNGGQRDQQMHAQEGEERDGVHRLSSTRGIQLAVSRYSHDESKNGVAYLENNQVEIMGDLSEARDSVQQNENYPMNEASVASSSYSANDQANLPRQGTSVLNRDYSLSSSLTLSRNRVNPQSQHLQGQLHNFIFKQLDIDPRMSKESNRLHMQVALTILNHPNVPHLMVNPHAVSSPVNFCEEIFERTGRNSHSGEEQTHQRIKFSERPARSCQPVIGAAPFTICSNCHELLQLPVNSSLLEKNELKMRCGSCSHANILELNEGRLRNSAPAPVSDVSSEDNYLSVDNPEDDIPRITEDRLSIDNNTVLVKEPELTSSEPDKQQHLSSSCSMSEKAESPDSVIPNKDDNSRSIELHAESEAISYDDDSRSTELPAEAEAISHVPSLSLSASLSGHLIVESRKERRHWYSDQEKFVSFSENFKQNSVKDVSVATELDVLADKHHNRGFSRDLSDTRKDDGRPRKSGDSKFLSHFLSRFNHSMGSSNSVKVFVNGHPISDRVAKKVEKQAGPIYPGEYWYDYHAGFWGVMGHPCCGIIPPCIDEFKYPMAKNCAGGNTGVLVNGRELNEKDLVLLADRGLPDTPGRSYRIETSGKVWDEASGEELDGLGNLAPNVERMKRGLGMRIPKVTA